MRPRDRAARRRRCGGLSRFHRRMWWSATNAAEHCGRLFTAKILVPSGLAFSGAGPLLFARGRTEPPARGPARADKVLSGSGCNDPQAPLMKVTQHAGGDRLQGHILGRSRCAWRGPRPAGEHMAIGEPGRRMRHRPTPRACGRAGTRRRNPHADSHRDCYDQRITLDGRASSRPFAGALHQIVVVIRRLAGAGARAH
jgi:hypothetical protein